MAIESVTGPQVPETVPGHMLKSSLDTMEISADTLGQLAALFQVISEKAGDHYKTKALANMGQFVAENAAENIGCECENTWRALGVEA